jgi:2-keto-4-pentenoate hydratase/2-oxohepta-3-ene-1,7-dioic acid hydratase in catechol pathway
VSPDELPAGPDLRAIARVNGEVRTDSRTGAMHWSWEDLLAAAARNTRGLRAGEVIGSGTVGGGCILEHADGRWLEPGDVVELEVEGIGVLRNTVGPPAP